MYSSFFGIEIAKKALFAQQRAQENVSHNIANANTPGYSRQRAIMESTYMQPYGGLNLAGSGAKQLGTGVKVEDIARIRDAFKDMQFREENSSLGFWEFQADSLKQVESIFNEPSDIGVSSVLTEFWKSLEELSKNPEAAEVRETVKERAVTLANTINHTASQLQQNIDDINFRISIKVDEVNNIAKQISELNAQIKKTEIIGVTASDLRDKRDLLLDDLSKLVNIDTYEDQNGTFTVTVGGAIMVKGSDYETMTFDAENPSNGIKWSGYGIDVNMSSGELKGLQELNKKIESYKDKLTTFAKTFAEKFNEIHYKGVGLKGTTNINFFKSVNPNDSADKESLGPNEIIAVDDHILNDTSYIAAAEGEKDADGNFITNPDGTIKVLQGDNKNALLLANLKYTKVSISENGNTINSTFDDYYGALISKLGVDSQEAQRMVDSQGVIVSQLDEQRKEVSSVSLDEEMAKMIMYQHAYNAAARMVTAVDEMIDTIVSKMGIVGR